MATAFTTTLDLTPTSGATFDPTLAASLDHIRLALGDTDTTDPMILDSTITAALAEYSYATALALLADALVAKYGQMPDKYSEDKGVSMQWTQRLKAWERVAALARSGAISDPAGTTDTAGRFIAVDLTTVAETWPYTEDGFRSD